MIKERRPDVLTLFSDSMTSLSCEIRSQSRKIVKFVKVMAQTFLNCESTRDLIVVLASMYDRRTAARPSLSLGDQEPRS